MSDLKKRTKHKSQRLGRWSKFRSLKVDMFANVHFESKYYSIPVPIDFFIEKFDG